MIVKLSYFKPNGKWYSDAEYTTSLEQLFGIWAEVRALRDAGRLPGLIEGHSPFIVSVDVPRHPHRHPHLVMLAEGDPLGDALNSGSGVYKP